MIKAIVMDMDGTLLDGTNHIRTETKQILIRMQQQGIRLVLASGRNYRRLLPYAKQLHMPEYGGYLIEFNGLCCCDLEKGSREAPGHLEPEQVNELFGYGKNLNCEIWALYDDGIYVYIPDQLYEIKRKLRAERNVSIDYPWTAGPCSWLDDLRDGYPDIHYIQSFEQIPQTIRKVNYLNDAQQTETYYNQVLDDLSEHYSIFRSSIRNIEIVAKDFDKGTMLKHLMVRNGWTADEIMIFGDAENDIPMFPLSHHSYAMGQAVQIVKQAAGHVTLSNDEQGIYEILKNQKSG